jgi:hydrogenase nickel incorporation protein HypB
MSKTIYRRVSVRRDVQLESKEDAMAERVRMTNRGTLVVNLVSSPGAGKTSLLVETAKYWNHRYSSAVLVGDLETDRDSERLSPWMPAAQLTTGGACHLQLSLVRRGLQALGDPKVDFLFIENVGNLVCPASHDLGEHIRVVLLSVTEGDDKPGKYPKMFRSSQAMVISKMDLLPHVPFSVESAIADAYSIQPDLTPLYVSAITGDGIANWCQFLENSRTRLLQSSVDHGSE